MIIRTEEDQTDQRQQIQQDFLILMSASQAGTLHRELCNVIEIQPCHVVFSLSLISSSTSIPGAVLTAVNKEARLNQISEVRVM